MFWFADIEILITKECNIFFRGMSNAILSLCMAGSWEKTENFLSKFMSRFEWTNQIAPLQNSAFSLLCHFLFIITQSRPAHNVRTTLYRRCYDFKTFKWRRCNIVLTSCTAWDRENSIMNAMNININNINKKVIRMQYSNL